MTQKNIHIEMGTADCHVVINSLMALLERRDWPSAGRAWIQHLIDLHTNALPGGVNYHDAETPAISSLADLV